MIKELKAVNLLILNFAFANHKKSPLRACPALDGDLRGALLILHTSSSLKVPCWACPAFGRGFRGVFTANSLLFTLKKYFTKLLFFKILL